MTFDFFPLCCFCIVGRVVPLSPLVRRGRVVASFTTLSMFDVASASALLTSTVTDASSLITSSLTTVLGVFAALLGLGFAISRVRKYIQRRKA